jgi:hypothetical protein
MKQGKKKEKNQGENGVKPYLFFELERLPIWILALLLTLVLWLNDLLLQQWLK